MFRWGRVISFCWCSLVKVWLIVFMVRFRWLVMLFWFIGSDMCRLLLFSLVLCVVRCSRKLVSFLVGCRCVRVSVVFCVVFSFW